MTSLRPMELENPQHIFHSHLLSHKCQWPVTIKNGLNEENVSPSFFFFFAVYYGSRDSYRRKFLTAVSTEAW